MEEKQCLNCRVAMDCLGVKEIRTGGTSGGWHLLLGDLANVSERKMKIEVWVCPHCRRLDFYQPE